MSIFNLLYTDEISSNISYSYSMLLYQFSYVCVYFYFFCSDLEVPIHYILILHECKLIQYIQREIFHIGFNTGNTCITKQAISSNLLKTQMLFRVIISLKREKNNIFGKSSKNFSKAQLCEGLNTLSFDNS